jgi:hypothetical protein
MAHLRSTQPNFPGDGLNRQLFGKGFDDSDGVIQHSLPQGLCFSCGTAFRCSAQLGVLDSGVVIPLGISPTKWWAWAPRVFRDFDFMGFPSLTTCIL